MCQPAAACCTHTHFNTLEKLKKIMTTTKTLRAILLAAMLVGVTGCATTNKDPLEGINRGIYKFNDVADRYAMQPVAKAYKTVAPSPVRTGVSNFFSNLGTLTTIVNDLLQLKFAQAFNDAGRFVINTTFGIAGFIDVASMDKIEKHQEDFGQTLGYWGVNSGPYLVLPILGPSTVRDAGGLAFDTFTSDPITYLHNTGQIRAHNRMRAVQLLDKRTQLLDATDLVDNASIDPYAFMRDAFLQRRASLIQDGLVPKDLLQDEFEPADEDAPAAEPAKQSQQETATQAAMPIPATAIVEPATLVSEVPSAELQGLPPLLDPADVGAYDDPAMQTENESQPAITAEGIVLPPSTMALAESVPQ